MPACVYMFTSLFLLEMDDEDENEISFCAQNTPAFRSIRVSSNVQSVRLLEVKEPGRRDDDLKAVHAAAAALFVHLEQIQEEVKSVSLPSYLEWSQFSQVCEEKTNTSKGKRRKLTERGLGKITIIFSLFEIDLITSSFYKVFLQYLTDIKALL